MGANTRDYWMDELQKAGITVTSINTVADALDDSQAAARKSVWDIDHPTLGSVPVLASALQHMSRTPAAGTGSSRRSWGSTLKMSCETTLVCPTMKYRR